MDRCEEKIKEHKAELVFTLDSTEKNKLKQMKPQYKFCNDIKRLKKGPAPEDFAIKLLHKHMFSIYKNLQPDVGTDQKNKLWKYFVSSSCENPLLEMVREVQQNALDSLDNVESCSARGETPILIDGHILGLLEKRGKKNKAPKSERPIQKSKKRKIGNQGASSLVLDQAEDNGGGQDSDEDDSDDEYSKSSNDSLEDSIVLQDRSAHLALDAERNKVRDERDLEAMKEVEAGIKQRRRDEEESSEGDETEQLVERFIHDIFL